jgi:hypothetical protein
MFSTELSTRGLWGCGARSGDGVLVEERRASEGDREAVINEVRGEHGRPPYEGCGQDLYWRDHALQVPPK